MYSIIISFAAAILIGLVTSRDLGVVWGVVCALFALVIVQLVTGLVIRKKVNAIQNKLQEIMQAAQVRINRQMQMFQQRPLGDMRLMQQKLETMQNDALHETLRATAAYEPYYRWNWMLPKQINTMKMQLYYQLKEFAKVDELLPKSFLMDPRSILIKLVRMYKTNDPKLDKFYEKKVRKIKGEDGALAACTYAWIKLRDDQTDQAVAALVEAKKLSDNPTLLENYDRLVNGKVKHFSNAGFGDIWYSLYLEEPKMKPQKAQQQRMY